MKKVAAPAYFKCLYAQTFCYIYKFFFLLFLFSFFFYRHHNTYDEPINLLLRWNNFLPIHFQAEKSDEFCVASKYILYNENTVHRKREKKSTNTHTFCSVLFRFAVVICALLRFHPANGTVAQLLQIVMLPHKFSFLMN